MVAGECSYAYISDQLELIVERKTVAGDEHIVGRAKLMKLSKSTKRRVIARLFIPPEQKVLSANPGETLTAAEAESSAYFRGEFIAEDGNIRRQIGVEVEPWGAPLISGIMDGNLILDVDSSDEG